MRFGGRWDITELKREIKERKACSQPLLSYVTNIKSLLCVHKFLHCTTDFCLSRREISRLSPAAVHYKRQQRTQHDQHQRVGVSRPPRIPRQQLHWAAKCCAQGDRVKGQPDCLCVMVPQAHRVRYEGRPALPQPIPVFSLYLQCFCKFFRE